jgi:hypothetical protein
VLLAFVFRNGWFVDILCEILWFMLLSLLFHLLPSRSLFLLKPVLLCSREGEIAVLEGSLIRAEPSVS